MIRYPILVTTYAAKSAFVERAVELLRLEYILMGKWWREGLELTEYQRLRNHVQVSWPYTEEKLSDIEWKRYRDTRFKEKERILFEERGQLRQFIYKSTRFDPNLDDDIV